MKPSGKMNMSERIYERYLGTRRRPSISSRTTGSELRELNYLYLRHIENLDRKVRILDLGCGNGRALMFLKENGFHNALGVDRSRESIDRCRSRGLRNVVQAEIGEFLEKNEDTYDLVFALDVLEHLDLEEAIPILDMTGRSLTDEGSLVIQTPNGSSPFGRSYFRNDITHKLLLTQRSIYQLLKTVGFRTVDILPVYPHFTRGIRNMSLYFPYKIIEGAIKATHLLITGEYTIVTPNIMAIAKKAH